MERVSPRAMREAFNQAGFEERVRNGQLRRRTLDYNTHLNRQQRARMNRDERTKVPFTRCTRSQMVLYSTREGKPLALVHQYTRPDGELAGSGMPNPHKLFLEGRVLEVRRTP